ncbi:MAG TPA: hypothetical protein VHA14_08870 [Bryobacteraceae bacterium]|nr:hypothetical protein [Bryobacteraceae bacterium]
MLAPCLSRAQNFRGHKKRAACCHAALLLEIRLSYFLVEPLLEPCELELPLPDFVASLSSFFVVLWLELLLLEPELVPVAGADVLGAVLGLPLLGAVWANVRELRPITSAGTSMNINLFFNFLSPFGLEVMFLTRLEEADG